MGIADEFVRERPLPTNMYDYTLPFFLHLCRHIYLNDQIEIVQLKIEISGSRKWKK